MRFVCGFSQVAVYSAIEGQQIEEHQSVFEQYENLAIPQNLLTPSNKSKVHKKIQDVKTGFRKLSKDHSAMYCGTFCEDHWLQLREEDKHTHSNMNAECFGCHSSCPHVYGLNPLKPKPIKKNKGLSYRKSHQPVKVDIVTLSEEDLQNLRIEIQEEVVSELEERNKERNDLNLIMTGKGMSMRSYESYRRKEFLTKIDVPSAPKKKLHAAKSLPGVDEEELCNHLKVCSMLSHAWSEYYITFYSYASFFPKKSLICAF